MGELNLFYKIIKLLFICLLFLNLVFSTGAVFNYNNLAKQTNNTAKEQSLLISYNYLAEDEIISLSQKIFPALRVSVNPIKKKIFIYGVPEDIRRFKIFINNIDTNRRTIYFRTWLLEISHNNLKGLGINWQGYKNGLNISQIIDKQKLFNNLQTMVSNGEAKILANPTLICLEDEIANIQVGDKIPYTVPVNTSSDKIGWELKYIDAGINLSLRANILEENIVLTTIKLRVDNIKQWKSTMAGEYPVLSGREINLQSQLRNNEELVLGGLINKNTRENKSKLPIIGEIPFVGDFFSYLTIEEEESEIIFIISPEIISK
jgi:general secretion pathway protein D